MNACIHSCAAACTAAVVLLLLTLMPVRAGDVIPDYVVTAESFESAYTINGNAGSPELTLIRGRTYTFSVSACDCHPFEIVGAPAGSVTNNNIFDGTITFNVPANAADYSYQCSVHFFGGTIKTIPPPDYMVTARSFDSAYTINGAANNPTLTLVRGRTYTFLVSSCSCHPFEIRGAPPGSVTNNNTNDGVITFNVPATAANYTYVCSFHLFGGPINTIAPPLSSIETWRQTHFGTTQNTGNAADTFDFDNDRLVNLVEFAFGLDPKQGSSLQLPQWQLQGGNFLIAFAQPAGVDGVIYGAEWSESMSADSWTSLTDTGIAGQHAFSVPVAGHNKLLVRLTVRNTAVP